MTVDRLRLDMPLRAVRGIGPKRAAALAELGIVDVEDLLYVLPARYEDRRAFAGAGELSAGGPAVAVHGEIVAARLIRTRRRGFTIFEARLRDDTGEIDAIWYNQAYLARALPEGIRVVLFGAPVERRRGTGIVLENPDHERLEEPGVGIHTGRIVPVHRRLGPLSPRRIRALVHEALGAVDDDGARGHVPSEVVGRLGLAPLRDALHAVHFPPPDSDLDALATGETTGHRRLVFEEMFQLQLVLSERRAARAAHGRRAAAPIGPGVVERIVGALPFALTADQARAVKDVVSDLEEPGCMSRLLQGDVGSGKTAVAAVAAFAVVGRGEQVAIMAPTEILAEQHLRSLRHLASRLDAPPRIERLTGSTPSAVRRAMLADLASGDVDIVVGTHALFEDAVSFRRLSMVVVDEQHRFGVAQRARLVAKGDEPDLLVMTATPIPRSLALTVYGDLDVSVIREKPPGRGRTRTLVRDESARRRLYDGIRGRVAAGGQAYVVLPRIEAEGAGGGSVADHARALREEHLPGLRVGMVHGRLPPAERHSVFAAFATGDIDVLVATTVVEVGLDIPNATVMVVEQADRFGLAQLHQLRGRVGRGRGESYCILMASREAGEDARERLESLRELDDGFRIAERDLEIRGPGEVFSTAQHGAGDLRFLGAALRDPELLGAARDEARAFLAGRSGAVPTAALRPHWRRRLDLARMG